jgi:RNA polymerase sigma-70 factor (ECF subfamily)
VVETSDGELVTQTRAGDADAYGALVARYQGHVYGLAYSLVENWAEAQDIAQETFIRAYLNLDQLQDPARFAAWLRRVTFSVAMNWLRAYRPQLFAQLDGRVDLDLLEVPDFRPGPAEVVEKRELAEVVLRAVQALPPKYRAPLTMFHLDGLSYQKVADFLDIPLGTAKALIHRARAKLREALTPYLTEEVAPMVQEVFNEHKLPAEFARKVLDRVPKLAWGTNRECTFLGALEAAVAITDHPYRYTDLMGWSGMAFRARWWSKDEPPRWCPSSAVAEMEEEIGAVATATGWPLRFDFMHSPEPSADGAGAGEGAARVARLTRLVTDDIDGGRAVLAYDPGLDMAVVYGYEDGGKTLLLRDYHHADEPFRLPPAQLGFLIVFLGDHKEPLSRRDALLESLRIALRNWERERFSEGPGEYWYGRAAMTRMAEDLANARAFNEEERRGLCQPAWFVLDTMVDARRAAATFLRGNAPLLDDAAAGALRAAADIYEQESGLLRGGLESVPFSLNASEWTSEMQQRGAEVLIEAREMEQEAIAEVKAALRAVEA